MSEFKKLVTKWKGCKHLDYTDHYHRCEVENAYDDNYYWKRLDEGDKVQFCGAGRGRINGIFQCINKGEMSCFEEQENENEKSS